MMFSLFRTRQTYPSSGLLQGLTDWHSHLLPGVDDGVATLDETLRILALYEAQSIADVWFTPHIMEDIPNTTAQLRARFAEVTSAYDGPIRLHLAAEYMLDNLFATRLAAGDLLPLGDDAHLLVETSYFNAPLGMASTLRAIQQAGYHPVLAHPERYTYMQEADYHDLRHNRQVLFQLNLYSLLGMYGRTAQQKARWLLREGYIDRVGTDTHRIEQVEGAWAAKELEKKDVEILRGIGK
jgi:tyrosine-protein phosphatase YwqE